MAGRVILVRHGQTTNNVKRVIDTHLPGAELSELGRTQAARVGKELAELTGGTLAAAWSSAALRAQQTLLLAAGAYERAARTRLPIGVKAGVQEIDAGELEGALGEDQIERYQRVLAGLMRGDAGNGFRGGEDRAQVLARTRGVLEELAAAARVTGDVALVSHGGASRFMAAAACGLDPAWAITHRLPNCRLIVMRPSGRPFGSWQLERWDTEAWDAAGWEMG